MPSPVPSRSPSGSTTDPPYGPLANCGAGNPFFYHMYADDFDATLATGATGIWTQTAVGGSIAHTAGDGGLALFTTGSTINQFCEIQLPAASFSFTAGKKSFFLTRLQLSNATNAALITGLIGTSTTPFTSVAEGVYFSKPTGSLTGLVLITTQASTPVSLTIPTAAYTLANATYIDLAFFIDRNQTIYAFVGSQLVGWIPQSGTGGVNAAGVSALPVLGACASMATSAGQALYPTAQTWVPSVANLNLTLAVQAGTGASLTMTSDFIMAAKER